MYDPTTGQSSDATTSILIDLPTPLTAPTFSVGTATYTSAQTETITIPVADTDVSDCVYYTTDSTTPATSSTEYTTALTVGASETVEAIVYDPTTGQSSDATTAIFTINLPTPLTAPTFSVGTGTYTSAQTETITIPVADTDVSDCVYYTTDSTTPATSSTEYTTALTVGASETVEAIVYDPTTGQSSDATTAIFTINLPTPLTAPTFSVGTGTYTSARPRPLPFLWLILTLVTAFTTPLTAPRQQPAAPNTPLPSPGCF